VPRPVGESCKGAAAAVENRAFKGVPFAVTRGMAKSGKQAGGLPSEAALLAFLAEDKAHPGKRDIARAFGLRGEERAALRLMLKDMEARGLVHRQGKRLANPHQLPPVTMLEVVGLTRDGELYGAPAEWDERRLGKPPRVLIETATDRGSAVRAPARGEHVLAKIEKGSGAFHFRARVMRSFSTGARRVLGVVRQIKGHGLRLVPVDKKARNDFQIVPGAEGGAKPGELVLAELDRPGRGLPTVRVRERLGDLNDPRNISLIAIHGHAIPNTFPEKVLAEAEALKPFARKDRADFTTLPLITIDPADARDHDDAVWAAADDDPANAGGFRVVVAIADVAAHVRPGTALDREARLRGNSVYFPDRVVPMLPERLSNDLCSLKEKVERPALAVTMVFNRRGEKKSHRFQRITMRSAAKLSYEEAQAAIDGRVTDRTAPLLDGVLTPLWAAWRCVLQARNQRSPLELDLPERRIILDGQGRVTRVVVPPRLDAHRLIEEFMILANVAAAEELEKHQTPLLYRIHDEPSDDKLRALAEFLKTVNHTLPLGQVMRPRHFNDLLSKVAGEDYQHLVHEIVLRTQAQALYAPENRGHFGLALRRYAHFTSPIRRYADLIVHRALITALGLGADGLSAEDIGQFSETGEMISDAERRAMAAERETNDRLIASYLAGREGAEFSGRIGGVVGAGLFIKLDDTGADGFVLVASLGRDYYVYDGVRHALIGQHTGETHQLGDRVTVRLVEVTPLQGGLRFELTSEGRKGPPAKIRRRTTPRPRRR